MPAVIYGAEKDVYAVGTQQLRSLGQKMLTPDGSVFRYSEAAGAELAANLLNQGAVPDSNLLSQLLTTAATIGDTTITQTDGASTAAADYLAGGTILMEETGDLGTIYRVKSNLATVSNEIVCTLEDGVTVQKTVAVAANNVSSALINLWKDIVVSPTSANAAANVGIARKIIAANGFGWVQTRGVASCLIDSTALAVLLGNTVRASEDDAGAVALYEEGVAGIVDYQIVGHCLETAPDEDFGHIWLAIE